MHAHTHVYVCKCKACATCASCHTVVIRLFPSFLPLDKTACA